jgi:hypothetical protein
MAPVINEKCAITGKPAKYRDPLTGLPYADLAAFKIIREQHSSTAAAVDRESEPQHAATSTQEREVKRQRREDVVESGQQSMEEDELALTEQQRAAIRECIQDPKQTSCVCSEFSHGLHTV